VFGVKLVLVKPLLCTFCHSEASEIISSLRVVSYSILVSYIKACSFKQDLIQIFK
jgi:hypothetical protein